MKHEWEMRSFGVRICIALGWTLLALFVTPQGRSWAERIMGRPTGDDRLLQALTNNDLADLRCALAEAAKAESRYPAGSTPLMLAACGNDSQLVRELLAHGAQVNTPGPLGFTALHGAAMGGRFENARALLEWGAEVNCATTSQITPLIAAARDGNTAMVSLLLSNGAKVDAIPGCRARVLVEAADSPDVEPKLIRLLIAAGADVNGSDAEGVLPLQAATRANREDLAEVLRSKGAQGAKASGLTGTPGGHENCGKVLQRPCGKLWSADVAQKKTIAALVFGLALCMLAGGLWLWGKASLAPASASPAQAPATQKVRPIKAGMLLSHSTSAGGYDGHLRRVREFLTRSIEWYPIIEPDTAELDDLPRVLNKYFPGRKPINGADVGELRQLDVIVADWNLYMQDDVLSGIEGAVSEGVGLVWNACGAEVPGCTPQVGRLAGLEEVGYGCSRDTIPCEIMGEHPLLGNLSGKTTLNIELKFNGMYGVLRGGTPLLRVKDRALVSGSKSEQTGVYPLYISRLGKGKIVGIPFRYTGKLGNELERAHDGRFYIHCVQWLANRPLN